MQGDLYPAQTDLGGPVPTEESWPGFSSAGDLSSTQALAVPIASSGAPAGSSSVPALAVKPVAVYNVGAYHRLATVPVPLNVALTDILALAAPGASTLRGILSIRNSFSSVGILLIAFDLPATDQTAVYSLGPGGFLFLDTSVPQNDVHLACTIAPSTAVIGFYNFPVS